MQNLMEGMWMPYFVLLLLGVLLFLILLYVLIYYVRHNQSLGPLLPFFLIPIIMIIFPGIKMIDFWGTRVILQDSIANVVAEPTNADKKAELGAHLRKLEQADNLMPATIALIGRGKSVYQDTTAAKEYLVEQFVYESLSRGTIDRTKAMALLVSLQL